ncbi:MAG: PAS domain S-box protein [Syntrophobacteraceae bacterium]|nr:PAS domain S-box protein [Syntrophobacteraceae bacterium]
MSYLSRRQRAKVVEAVHTLLAGQSNETGLLPFVQAAIDQCDNACENVLASREKTDCLVRSFVENAENSGLDCSIWAVVLSCLKSISLPRRGLPSARLNRFLAAASEAMLRTVSKERMQAIAQIQETKRQIDTMKLNTIKFTTKLGRGWIDVGGSRMFLLDIEGGWYNFVRRIVLFAGADTSRRVLFEAGQSETFTTKALELGFLEKSPKGFVDALDTLSEAGIGNFSVKELSFEKPYARITCPDTFEGWAHLESGKMSNECVCHFSSGALLSFMQHTSGEKDLISTETRCIAKGDDSCEFIVGGRKELEQQGITAREWGMTIKERAEALENLLAEKEKAEKEIRKRNTELAALNKIASAVSQSLDLREISCLAVKELRKMVGEMAVMIYLLDAVKQELTIAAQEGFSEEFITEVSRLNLGQGLAGNVACLGIPTACDDYSSYSRPIKAALEKENLRSVLAVPLMANKRVVGVLNVASKTPHHFSRDEIDLFTMIGTQIGAATDKALLHKDLKESERKYKTLVRDINDGYFVCQDDRIVFANPAFLSMHGYDEEEVLGGGFREFISSASVGDVESMITSQASGRSGLQNVEFSRRHKDGRSLPTELKVSLSEFEGRPAIIGISRDISERKRFEQKILEKERLASIGEVAASLAHEIRNPISAIKMSIQILSKNLKVHGFDKKRLDIAMKEIKRLDDFLQDILDFSKPIRMNKTLNSVSEIISKCVDLLDDQAGNCNISLSWKKPRRLRKMVLDFAKIQEVLLDILVNSMDAMPQGGEIHIAAKEVKTETGPMIEIEIKDTGIGIQQEHLPKIFDPFFSTKTAGSGLGLANVKRIVEAHNGAIDVKSLPSVGTSLKILFPVE